MGVADLRDAFNAAAFPDASCERAWLTYERAHDVEWQILTFRGKRQDGSEFEVRADPLRPGADPVTAAREMGAKMKPASVPQAGESP